jgi:hypothetical protein
MISSFNPYIYSITLDAALAEHIPEYKKAELEVFSYFTFSSSFAMYSRSNL